jgi:hypothetical protein
MNGSAAMEARGKRKRAKSLPKPLRRRGCLVRFNLFILYILIQNNTVPPLSIQTSPPSEGLGEASWGSFWSFFYLLKNMWDKLMQAATPGEELVGGTGRLAGLDLDALLAQAVH